VSGGSVFALVLALIALVLALYAIWLGRDR